MTKLIYDPDLRLSIVGGKYSYEYFALCTDPAFVNLPDSQNKIAEYYDRRSSRVVMETNDASWYLFTGPMTTLLYDVKLNL